MVFSASEKTYTVDVRMHVSLLEDVAESYVDVLVTGGPRGLAVTPEDHVFRHVCGGAVSAYLRFVRKALQGGYDDTIRQALF